MPTFHVTATRSESVTVEIEAESRDDAVERWERDGTVSTKSRGRWAAMSVVEIEPLVSAETVRNNPIAPGHVHGAKRGTICLICQRMANKESD